MALVRELLLRSRKRPTSLRGALLLHKATSRKSIATFSVVGAYHRCVTDTVGGPDKVAILDKLVSRFSPISWRGSRAVIIAARSELLTQLSDHPDQALAECAMRARARLQQQIEEERRLEMQRYKTEGERFE